MTPNWSRGGMLLNQSMDWGLTPLGCSRQRMGFNAISWLRLLGSNGSTHGPLLHLKKPWRASKLWVLSHLCFNLGWNWRAEYAESQKSKMCPRFVVHCKHSLTFKIFTWTSGKAHTMPVGPTMWQKKICHPSNLNQNGWWNQWQTMPCPCHSP